MTEFFYQDRTCPICGKKFICQDYENWVYRSDKGRDAMLFCSWSCFRKWENGKPKVNRHLRREKIIQAIKDHPDMKSREIALMLNEEPKTVYYWCQKLRQPEDGRKDDDHTDFDPVPDD